MAGNGRRCLLQVAVSGVLMFGTAMTCSLSAQEPQRPDGPTVNSTTPGIIVEPSPFAGPMRRPAATPSGVDSDANGTAPAGCPFRDHQQLQLIVS